MYLMYASFLEQISQIGSHKCNLYICAFGFQDLFKLYPFLLKFCEVSGQVRKINKMFANFIF